MPKGGNTLAEPDNISLDLPGNLVVGGTMTLANFTNAQHNHSNATGGGTFNVTNLTTSGATDGQKLTATSATAFAFEDDFETINFVIDGGGAAITTGVKGDIEVSFACQINEWRVLLSAAESITVTITNATYAAYDTFSAFSPALAPNTSSAKKNTATGLTTNIAANLILRFDVTAAPATARLCTVALKVKRT